MASKWQSGVTPKWKSFYLFVEVELVHGSEWAGGFGGAGHGEKVLWLCSLW